MAGKTYEMMLRIAGRMDSSLRTACRNADTQLASLGRTAKTIGRVAAVGATAIGAGIAASVKEYATFEQAMAKTAALARATPEDYDRMVEAARAAGRETTKTGAEAAEAMGYMALAGWNVDDSISGLLPVLRLAEATEMDLARCSDLVTDSMSAMGVGVDGMAVYLDKIANAQLSANYQAEELMEVFIKCGGVAQTAGVEFNDLATAAGVLATAGLKGADVGTALRTIMQRLTTNSKAMNAMAEQGIDVFDRQTGQFRGLGNILRETSDAMANMRTDEATQFLAAVGGEFSSALGNLIGSFGEDAAEFGVVWDDLWANIANSSGTLDTVSAQMQDTLIGDFSRLKSAFSDMLIEIGTSTESPLRGILQDLTAAMPQIQEAVMQVIPKIVEFGKTLWDNRETIITFAEVVGSAFLTFKTVTTVLTAIDAIKNIVSAFSMLSAGVRGLGALRLAATALLGPFGWVGIAIAAVIAVIVLLIKHKDKVIAFFNFIAEVIWQVVDWIINACKNIVAKIAEWFGKVKDKVVEALSNIKAAIVARLNAIKAFWSAAWNAVVSAVSSIFGRVKSVVTGIISGVQGAISNGVNAIKSVWTNAWNAVVSSFQAVFGRVRDIASNVMNGVLSAINSVINAVQRAVDALRNLAGMSVGGGAVSAAQGRVAAVKAQFSASGGITNGPALSWVGEGSENEAILPLSKLASVMDSERSIGRMEAAPVSASGSVVFSPTINISGNASRDDVVEATRISFNEFKRMYERMQRETRRTAFAMA